MIADWRSKFGNGYVTRSERISRERGERREREGDEKREERYRK